VLDRSLTLVHQQASINVHSCMYEGSGYESRCGCSVPCSDGKELFVVINQAHSHVVLLGYFFAIHTGNG
jgi:hypothetical protein